MLSAIVLAPWCLWMVRAIHPTDNNGVMGALQLDAFQHVMMALAPWWLAAAVYPSMAASARGETRSFGKDLRAGIYGLAVAIIPVIAAVLVSVCCAIALVVPGVLMLGALGMVGPAASEGGPLLDALDASNAAAAPRRARAVGVAIALILGEVALTAIAHVIARHHVGAKPAPADLAQVTFWLRIDTLRVLITAPLAALAIATVYSRWRAPASIPAMISSPT